MFAIHIVFYFNKIWTDNYQVQIAEEIAQESDEQGRIQQHWQVHKLESETCTQKKTVEYLNMKNFCNAPNFYMQAGEKKLLG